MFEPLQGPDLSKPLEEFACGDFWFRLLVFPARLPIGRLWHLADQNPNGLLDDIATAFYEEGVGALLLRFDPRYKIMVTRRHPWARMNVVAVDVAPAYDEALARCADLLSGFASHPEYITAVPMSSKDVRRTVREAG